ncbi:hypothetical protein D9601_02415 [Sphingomonas sp. MA1305]|uniref:packaged DNA stabilization protein n=1 Tax=Sphingomonas sp. MA1305 TaxID=2479204 RepID=UPI0018E03BA5|nr:packaged DNA stabilization protein [Sphingomonas sp. MA1305]MBI0474219.1 hypothetical protein [Sphingomonas sp. MA1305]
MAAKVPFGIQTYRRYDLPPVRLVNLYAEQVPTGKDSVVLLPRPALRKTGQIGSGPVNGIFQQSNISGNALFVLSGDTLYAGPLALGTVTGAGTAKFAGVDGATMLTRGADLYRTDGATLTQIAFPDGASTTAIAYLAGYAVASRANTRRLYFALDSTNWDALDYVSAEQSTEAIIGMSVLVDQLAVFCTRHTEFFFVTGDADAPFQRVQGRIFDKGAKTKDAIVRMDNTVFWVGHDNIVYRADNEPVRVSDHGIEELISKSQTAVAWSYPWQGHLFYVLQLDTTTIAYDAATQQWHELASYGRDRWRGRIGFYGLSGMVVGDEVDGTLYTLDENTYADQYEVISREFTVLIDGPAFVNTLSVDVSNATDDNPGGLLELRTSRDNGKNWSAYRQQNLGGTGQTRKRAMFRRCGRADQTGYVMQFRLTSAVASRISSVRLNDIGGGRGR